MSKTQAQIDYCNGLIKRYKRKKRHVATKTITTNYMSNCIFWIEEYLAGRTDKASCEKSIAHLEQHIQKLKIELKINGLLHTTIKRPN